MKPAIIAGLVAALLAGGFWYRHHVYDEAYAAGAAYQKDLGERALAQANTANQKKSDELQDRVDTLNTEQVTKNEKAAKDLEAARADVRAGRQRLSIAGACSRGAGAGAPAGAAASAGAEERTDLLPGTADSVLRIAGHIAQDMRDYNDLLDSYNAVCK